MTDVSLPITSRTSSDDLDFADVYANDSAIADVVNGNLTAANLANNAVETAKIAASNVTAPKLESALLQAIGANDGSTTRRDYEEVATEQSTSSTSFTNLSTVGPTVTVTVPTNGFVVFFASVEAVQLEGLGARAALFEGTTQLDIDSLTGGPGGFQVDSLIGATPATAGSHTYHLKYMKVSGGGSFGATFKNRKLWAIAIGGF